VSATGVTAAEPTAARSPTVRARRGPTWIAVAAAAVVLLIAARVFVAEPLRVRSSSMSPTLRGGDQVLVDKFLTGGRMPQRRDIIVLRSPGTGELLVKRVAAVAGDVVGLDAGVLVVNGHQVREGYVDYQRMVGVYYGPVRVPAGDVFVLGDNRPDSVDSRTFGPVPVSRITGRVLLRIWPPR
jgi:signal peptidase I